MQIVKSLVIAAVMVVSTAFIPQIAFAQRGCGHDCVRTNARADRAEAGSLPRVRGDSPPPGSACTLKEGNMSVKSRQGAAGRVIVIARACDTLRNPA
jgi:hypothetical protein